MARARKSSSSRKSGKRKRDGRNASKQKLKLTIESVSELPAADDSAVPLADRYYDLAETMNARGAIEMAVPFYRQALALLLEERKQLRQLLPEAEQTRSAQNAQIPEAELNGLLADDSSLRGSDLDLEARVDELAEELNVSSAQQVLAGVAELLSLNGSRELPASGHSLRGKAHLLLGEQEDAWRAFAAARAADPKSPQHALNLAASLLTQKKHQEALDLLRPLHQLGLAALPRELREPLLRNLATAEMQVGQSLAALQLRRQWLQLNPDAVTQKRWLQWARVGLEQERGHPCRLEGLALLQDLHRLKPEERSVKEALADALESEGEYRQAALLYRDLLRP